MRNRLFTLALAALAALTLLTSRAASAADEKVSGPDDPAYAIQGEYVGELKPPDGGDGIKVGAQVIALGDGKFRAIGLAGGLPGEGWDEVTQFPIEGEIDGGIAKFESDQGRGEIEDGVLRVLTPADEVLAELKKVERKSPTLGAKPPEGAVVLFDGTSADAFEPGKMTDDGLLIAGANTKRTFGDCQLHLEFQLPFMPEAEGQARGNSGCYLQGRYEVQVLDSFGLSGANNECGGIYEVKAPSVNMCFPPLAWQTYDIDFTAPKFEDGKKVANAKITVKHNGQVIQQDVEVPDATRGAISTESAETGPIHLQDHGNPVRYRNIWVVEK